MVFLRALADGVLALVDDAVDGDVGLVDFGEGQPRAVFRPPEAVAAPHLFLRDVLGEAVRASGAARAFGELAGLPRRAARCRRADDVEFGVLHVGDGFAVRRELRIEGGAVVFAHDLSERSIRSILDVDFAAERNQQP